MNITTTVSFETKLAKIPICIKKLENQLYIAKGFLFQAPKSKKFQVVFKATEDIILYGIDLPELSADEEVTICFSKRSPEGYFRLIYWKEFPRVDASSSDIVGARFRMTRRLDLPKDQDILLSLKLTGESSMIGFDGVLEMPVNITRGRKAVLFNFDTFKDVVEHESGSERGLDVRLLFKLPIS